MRFTDLNSKHRVRQVCLYVTRHCNLNCSYCKVPRFQKEELDTAKWIKILDLVKKKVAPEFIVLFGGEPFVREDISKLVDYTNTLDIAYTLITNGTIDNEEVIRKLKGLTLSIDRPTSEKGFGEAAKSNWGMLNKYKNIVPDLVANITVTKSNIDDLRTIVQQLNEMKLWIIFSWLHWNGRPEDKFRANCPELGITTEEDLKKFSRAYLLADKRHNSIFYLELIRRHYKDLDWHYRMDLNNPEYMIIDSDGTFMADPDFWGEEVKKISIFDDDFTVDKWWKLCRLDRVDERCPGSIWNHEMQLHTKDRLVH